MFFVFVVDRIENFLSNVLWQQLDEVRFVIYLHPIHQVDQALELDLSNEKHKVGIFELNKNSGSGVLVLDLSEHQLALVWRKMADGFGNILGATLFDRAL